MQVRNDKQKQTEILNEEFRKYRKGITSYRKFIAKLVYNIRSCTAHNTLKHLQISFDLITPLIYN